ncbi:hypothetical protein QZH41_018007 [Actinostola sp. cb2023]|nr:hypothetical protein QZH41_018007 [Actinostola sp. cb2023]
MPTSGYSFFVIGPEVNVVGGATTKEDIVLEGLESHHQDVCNSLSQRTWIVLRVHELWKADKPLEALTTCMELTGVKKVDVSDNSGSLSGSLSALDMVGNKDIVLFLNILQQLPSGCSAWSLDMCDLLLPELKLFISTRIHTSHVDMACNVLHVIVKKVSGALLKAQTANKEKSDILKKCVSYLQDVKEKVSQVLSARRGKTYSTLSTEDPIALKPALRELLTAIQTLLSMYIE